jgi:hypothetical protein
MLSAVGLSGCKRAVVPVAVAVDPDAHLTAPAEEAAVADWLNVPRPDLDKRFEDHKRTATRLMDVSRGDRQSVQLLPGLRPVLTLPVFQEASFSAAAGVSLPPYGAEARKDAQLALHLARFGDPDGALLLTDPADAERRKEIESLRPGRNYPVEWTRLVALAQFEAELQLSRGDAQGASTLINLHQQLRIVLDPKAASGPLGAALLSGGRRALQAAAARWEEVQKTGYAADVKTALDSWGDVPEPIPALAPGASRSAVEQIFPAAGKAHALNAFGGAAARAFDLLAAPVPFDEMEGISAFLDGQDKLAEIAVLYRPRAGQTYPDPAHLGQRLVNFGIAPNDKEDSSTRGTLRQTFSAPHLSYELTLVPRGSTIGAVVRIADTKEAPVASLLPADSRDFGAVNFDRSFDQDRLAVAPEQRSSETVTITKVSELRRVVLPAPEPRHAIALPQAQSLQLRRLEGFDLLASLSLRWDRGENSLALARLAVPLLAAYGAPRFEPAFDTDGGHLALVWEDQTMRYSLRLPHDEDQAPGFSAEDKRGATGAAERDKGAKTFDRDQRAARLAAGKPLQRLPRAFDEASGVKLGMPRAEVEGALPASQSLRKVQIDGGWSVYFLKPAAGNAAAVPQQLIVRFGPGDKVAELRQRYLERAAPKGDKTPTLLAHFSNRSGAPETLETAPWSTLWSDLPPQRPSPALYRWSDDTTLMTLQRDGGGAEVTLRENPFGRPEGLELPPLRFVSRGVEGCSLGDDRSRVLEHWKVTDPTKTPDGGDVMAMPKSSPYEALVAYYDQGKVVRILAYHRMKTGFTAGEVPAALQESWGRDIDHLGAVRRQDTPGGGLVGGFGWHDDLTRVRTFAQDTDQGPRLHTEWREWSPAQPPKGVAAAN